MINRIIKAITLLATFIIIVYLSIYFLELINFKCIYKELFNIYCPGCGFTRMLKSIFELNFYQAFRYNPLFFILIILFIPYFIYKLYVYIKKGIIELPNYKILILLASILIIYMILRNISIFNYLIPTKV